MSRGASQAPGPWTQSQVQLSTHAHVFWVLPSSVCDALRLPAPWRPGLIPLASHPGLAKHIGSVFTFLWN